NTSQERQSSLAPQTRPYQQNLGANDVRQEMLSLSQEQKDRKDRLLREREAVLTRREQGLAQRENQQQVNVGRHRREKERLARRRQLFLKDLDELRQLRRSAEKY